MQQHSVLIVDDSKLARISLTAAIRRSRPEWQVLEAKDAAEGLNMIQIGGVDIVLIDFNMPGTDGLTMAASIRETNSRMPIAMVSANIQEEIIARARQLSVAFVPKPIMDESIGAFLSGAALRLRKTA
jgi:CheY-like chemotaxis protein